MKVGCARLPALSTRVGMNRIKATRLPICYRNHHPRRPDIDTTDMDDIRKSLSKLKKDFKHRVGGKKRGEDRAGVDTAQERTDSQASLLRPGPRAVGGKFSTDASQARSRDPSSHPEPVAANEDRLGDPSRKEVDVGKKEVSRSRSGLNPDAGGASGSGPSRETELAYSPPSVTPIAPKPEADSMWTLSPRLLCLITLLDKAANKKSSSWKSTAFATAKLLLRGVRDSADAFGPLKSVAGGLCFILENCEVRSNPYLHCHNSDRYPRE